MARSCIDTPVVQPSNKSTVTVNGVPSIEVLSSTCILSSNSWQRSVVMGAHRTPRPSRSMKLTFSSVIFSAAMMKSPSFSRSSSSTTMTNSPRFSCSTASSMVFSLISSIMVIILFFYFFYFTVYSISRSYSPLKMATSWSQVRMVRLTSRFRFFWWRNPTSHRGNAMGKRAAIRVPTFAFWLGP